MDTNQNRTGEYRTPYNVDIDALGVGDFDSYLRSISRLPRILNNILFDFSTAEFIEENLGPNFQLSLDQKKEVTRIIRDLILLKFYLGDLINRFQEKLNLNQQKSRDMINYIFSGLFTKEVLEELKKIQIARFGQISPSSPPQLPIQTQPPQIQPFQPSIQAPKTEVQANPNVVDLRNSG